MNAQPRGAAPTVNGVAPDSAKGSADAVAAVQGESQADVRPEMAAT